MSRASADQTATVAQSSAARTSIIAQSRSSASLVTFFSRPRTAGGHGTIWTVTDRPAWPASLKLVRADQVARSMNVAPIEREEPPLCECDKIVGPGDCGDEVVSASHAERLHGRRDQVQRRGLAQIDLWYRPCAAGCEDANLALSINRDPRDVQVRRIRLVWQCVVPAQHGGLHSAEPVERLQMKCRKSDPIFSNAGGRSKATPRRSRTARCSASRLMVPCLFNDTAVQERAGEPASRLSGGADRRRSRGHLGERERERNDRPVRPLAMADGRPRGRDCSGAQGVRRADTYSCPRRARVRSISWTCRSN